MGVGVVLELVNELLPLVVDEPLAPTVDDLLSRDKESNKMLLFWPSEEVLQMVEMCSMVVLYFQVNLA